jgi:hypothetical protein
MWLSGQPLEFAVAVQFENNPSRAASEPGIKDNRTLYSNSSSSRHLQGAADRVAAAVRSRV